MNKLKNLLSKALHNFEDALYPEYSCLICGRETKSNLFLICERCKQKLVPLSGNQCQKCGMPIAPPAAICDDCKSHEIHFDKATAAYIFDDTSAKLVYGIKYSGHKFAAKHLAAMLVSKISNFGQIDTIIPVPLHPNRKKWRGYNQSELLAKEMSEMTSIAVDTTSLERHIETETQQGKGRTEREANMIGAFRVTDKNAVASKSILVVDDVFTTGTTVNECARVLKKNGAAKVFVATVLKTTSALSHTKQTKNRKQNGRKNSRTN